MNPSNILEAHYNETLDQLAKEQETKEAERQKLQGKWDEWNQHPQTEEFLNVLNVQYDEELSTLLSAHPNMTEIDIRTRLSRLSTLRMVAKTMITGK